MRDYTTSSLTANLPRVSEINDTRDAEYRQGNALDVFFVSSKPLQRLGCPLGNSVWVHNVIVINAQASHSIAIAC